MPAYNVASHIENAVISLPEFVDTIIVVDDKSTDDTANVVQSINRTGLYFEQHENNKGVGAAIAYGYNKALQLNADFIVVMAGDGQMDPCDLPDLLNPLVEGRADYVKGNRFKHPDIWSSMPKTRLIGNLFLSIFTKITSGYWHLFDSQCGYTAISRFTLQAIGCRMFERYGYPNDILARLKTVNAKVVDVRVRPIYEGQKSGINLLTIIYPILFVLLRSLFRRIWVQYRGGHTVDKTAVQP